MNEFTKWIELFFASLNSFGQELMKALPNILGAILILLFGWLIAKLSYRIILTLLKKSRIDTLISKLKIVTFLENTNSFILPSKLIAKFVYWFFMLVTIIAATDTMGWKSIGYEVSKLIDYLPNLFIGIFIFVIGLYIASFVKNIIKGSISSLNIHPNMGTIVYQFAYYFLLIIISLTALKHIGINTTIITANLFLIFGVLLLTMAITTGFASRNIVANGLASTMVNQLQLKVGQQISIKIHTGEIIAINRNNLSIKTNEDVQINIPIKEIIQNPIVILK